MFLPRAYARGYILPPSSMARWAVPSKDYEWPNYRTETDCRMLEFLKTNWSDILAHIAQHLWLVTISIVIAIAIGLPLGILITRRNRIRGPVLGIPNVIQTIPSLALFGFPIPLPVIVSHGHRTRI